MIQDGVYINLGEPLNPLSGEYIGYVGTSHKRQGLTNDSMVVGLTHNTRSLGKPSTWGRGQQRRNSVSACFPDTRRSDKWKR